MTLPPFPMTGSCRCGATEIEAAMPPLLTAACHCRGCQKMSASAFSLTAMFPSEAFRVVQGTPVAGGAKGEDLAHYCCPECLTWMFTRISGVEAFVNVRPTMFADTSWFTPFIETWTAAKHPFAFVDAEHSFEHFPSMEEFGGLLEAYAAKG
ncbi:GFA family protein [Leisingera sp. ANG59]|uniref:GFA family protein n=1 Tax=Leisingera sp. ANG59 TaxID=2675221 RepID=UPI001572AB83|nr:GFA family protein [Leisingera sp. ANG59]NSY36956.1 aldehyde-activating protein [Leisingera sp. ANG59]